MLTAVEDEAIREAIAPEDVGLPVVTDGETRRSFWHDFMRPRGFKFVERRGDGPQLMGANKAHLSHHHRPGRLPADY